jgi:ATP-binding cassette subfamily F protein 3
MLTLSNVAKAFGDRTLFSEVTFQVNGGDRLGLVGANGAGKSTLFNLILKQEEPDAGSLVIQRGSSIGFLPQESAPVGEETVLELACASPSALSLPKKDQDVADDLESDHSHMDFDGTAVARAKRILKGLAFREEDFERPARTLSGGWVMRAHLARLLVQEPDLLMLDEPTNHLDLETLLWFQRHLKSYPGGILLISHDREFLNQLVTGILEIRNSRLWRYTGNYDRFLEQRDAQEAQQLAAYKNQQREIERMMDFVDRFRAKSSKAKQAQAKLKQIDRMEKVEAPEVPQSRVAFNFPQPESSGQRVLSLRKILFGYGDQPVYSDLDFELTRGERIVLVGPNGAGKSTLLKLLAGVLTPQSGEIDPGLKVKTGYYAQYRSEMLQPNRTVLKEALDTPARVSEQAIRTLLGCFLFTGDDVFKKVEVLSGGEKSRLALVKLLLDPPNLLLLDEPTTHLDIPSIDALVGALSDYTGTLVFISHDVYFIRAIARKVVHIHSGTLTPYAGDYGYYLEKSRASSARQALTAPLAKAGAGNESSQRANAQALSNAQPVVKPISMVNTSSQPSIDVSALSQKERRQLAAEARRQLSGRKKRVTELESKITRLEEKQVALAAELEAPETYQTPGRAAALTEEIRLLVLSLEETTKAWEQAANDLASVERDAVESK